MATSDETPVKKPGGAVGCFLRTHFWDRYVETGLSHLQAAWQGPVHLITDQTKPFDVPGWVPRIDHSLEEFLAYGLPLLPVREQAIWYNGDYALYDLCFKTRFDYFVLCDYDLAVNIPLAEVTDRMIADGCDFVAPSVGDHIGSWHWGAVQKQWYDLERRHHNTSLPADIRIYKSFFPFVFCSRRAALQLYARRLECAWLQRRLGGTIWPMSESFTPTELTRFGFKIQPLKTYVTPLDRVTVHDAVTWAEAAVAPEPMLHPVLGGQRFVNKLQSHSQYRKLLDPAAKRDWLDRQQARVEADRPAAQSVQPPAIAR